MRAGQVPLHHAAQIRESAIGVDYTIAPRTEDVEWQLQGLCRSGVYDPDLWTPNGRNRERKSLDAKILCESCPVVQACAEWALRTHEKFGVWGGLSEGDRDAIWTGIPRKRQYHHQESA